MVHSVAGLREWSTLHSATTSCCSWCQIPSRGVYVHACKWELAVPCTCIYMRMWVYAYVLVGTYVHMPQLLIFYENVYICVVRLYYLLQALFGAVKCTYIVSECLHFGDALPVELWVWPRCARLIHYIVSIRCAGLNCYIVYSITCLRTRTEYVRTVYSMMESPELRCHT